MAIPANYLALLGTHGAQSLNWIEIEGLPYAYGTRAQAASFWTSLAVTHRFESLLPYLDEVPPGVDARLDPLEGLASPGEFRFSVVDVDGFLTQASNVGRDEADPDALWLTADAAAGAATLSVGGNLAAWPTSGIAYLGRETVKWTGKGAGTLTGVTRGHYRSQDVLHTKGESVTQYPQHLGLRRCWFYQALSSTSSFAVGDRVARYAGLIEDYGLDGLTKWSLVVRTPEKELGEKTQLFRGFRSGRLVSALPAPLQGGSLAPATGTTETEGASRDATTGEVVLHVERTDYQVDVAVADGEWIYMRVEDEIILAQWVLANGRFEHVYRGLYGTVAVEHAAGADWREGTAIVKQDATGVPEVRHSKFTQGDSPEAIILQLLLSSGTYGVLPESWNGGFEPARVNVASFEGLRDTVHASERLVAWVDEPVSFRDLVVEHLLKPFGLYLIHAPDDTIECRYLRVGPPAATVATIDPSQIVGQVKWASGLPDTVGEYRLEADLDPLGGLGGDPATIMVDVFIDTRRLYGKRTKSIVHRSVFAHMQAGSVVPAGSYRMAARMFDSRRAYFQARHSRPAPAITVETRWSLFHLQPGDAVSVVIPQIPSVVGSGRSYSGSGYVVSRRPLDKDAKMQFTVALLGFALDHYASVSPAAKVASVAGGDITVTAAFFSSGDAAKFAVGDKVVSVDPKFSALSAATTVQAVAGNVITVSPAIAPAAGDYLVFADYDSQATAQKAGTDADLADANEQLGAANDAADRYSGI